MPSEEEIKAANVAYQNCDSYSTDDMMKAALEAAEKVREPDLMNSFCTDKMGNDNNY